MLSGPVVVLVLPVPSTFTTVNPPIVSLTKIHALRYVRYAGNCVMNEGGPYRPLSCIAGFTLSVIVTWRVSPDIAGEGHTSPSSSGFTGTGSHASSPSTTAPS